MKQIMERLTFANVMSAIAVFLVLGGTAFAASQLGKNTVGTKQLKKNAVTKAKIKKGAVSGDKLANGAVTETKLGDNSVGTGKIQNGAVNGDKVADGSLSGADINAGSVPFSQVVARIRNGNTLNLQATGATLIGTYNQPANEDDIYLGGLDVTFAASCAAPRSAAVYLLLDNPTPTTENIIGLGVTNDTIGGTATKRLEFGDYGIAGSGGMQRMGTGAAQSHAYYAYVAGGSCNSGSGISGSNLGIDILGTK